MREITLENLSDVAETLLLPLLIRALESERPDALIKDENAVALARQVDPEFVRAKLADISDESRVAMVLRTLEIDRHARKFLAHHPDAVVVHIGCGLDARFARTCAEQADNGQVEWYDLDLPEVVELRRKLIGGEGPHYHLLAGSVLDGAWLNAVSTHRGRPFLFLAEGVLMYLTEAQVRWLVLTLTQQFPGAELVFDAFSPFFSWANNLRVKRTGVGARSQWALKRGRDLEAWGAASPIGGASTPGAAGILGADIRLLDEWFPYIAPEPRLARARQIRHIPLLARVLGIFHYRLGTTPL